MGGNAPVSGVLTSTPWFLNESKNANSKIGGRLAQPHSTSEDDARSVSCLTFFCFVCTAGQPSRGPSITLCCAQDDNLRRCGKSFGDFVDGAVDGDEHVLAEGEPLGGLGMFGEEVVVGVGVEFHVFVFCEVLGLGVDPLIAVLEEGAAVHVFCLLGVLRDFCGGLGLAVASHARAHARAGRVCISCVHIAGSQSGRGLFGVLQVVLALGVCDAVLAVFLPPEIIVFFLRFSGDFLVGCHCAEGLLADGDVVAAFVLHDEVGGIGGDDAE